ncbi:diguanylate cyclase [Candidatus Sulfurimonas marisnigri]|uniref:diguanylate cyclase n=1 Tax=Candidatus Sulfurimonas marisnigri TaxID=2740405 RepID=A0A7S7M2B8_9BACT|nr:response regulator [Candidatus Sulfurimonas marisnigri]QOY55248.1 diguanylate cyclase [Candidatus Sulfurimonas marisnigri]
MNSLEKLELLRNNYAKELPSKIEHLQLIFDKGIKNGFDESIIDEFYRSAHNLIGSGATFGFLELSRAANNLEKAISAYLRTDKPISKAEIEDLRLILKSIFLATKAKSRDVHLGFSNDVIKSRNSSISIYIIDDDQYIHEELKIQLENFGYNVKSFHDTKSFEKAALEKAPDIVMMDITFPDEDHGGISSIRRIKKDFLKPFILFFISSNNDFVTRINAIRVGCDGYFTKPLDMVSLLDKLEYLTNKKSSDEIQVLMLDDKVGFYNTHLDSLSDSRINTHFINNPELILEAMSDFRPDIVLLDLDMPQYDGVEVAKVIRQMDEYISIPIIFLTDKDKDNFKDEALDTGVEDIILKSTSQKNLIYKIQNKAQHYKNIRAKIQSDSLTGLYNHTTIMDLLVKEISNAKRYGYSFSFAMIDIDYFKKVNDTFGHQAGDSVLKTLSHFMTQRVRTSDLVGRYGGEEFCIILPHAICENAKKMLDDMRIKFSNIVHYGGDTEFYSTISIGVCQWNKDMKIVTLIENTDKAMYLSKNNGRNQTTSC